MGSCVDWQGRRAKIATAVLDLYLERPWPNVGIEEIAERLGIGYWQVYHSFDGQEDMYRAAVTRLVDTLADTLAERPKPCSSINRTIQNYVRYAADIVSMPAYGKLLFLCLRDEHTDPWVKSAYETGIAEPLRRNLETEVAAAGRRNDLRLVMVHNAPNLFLTTLEANLALPKLLRNDAVAQEHIAQTIAAATKQIFSATCTFDGFGDDPPSKCASMAA
ncbi:MAG: hypothetical protein AAGE05_01905 [Pseudomonadota bacterium]